MHSDDGPQPADAAHGQPGRQRVHGGQGGPGGPQVHRPAALLQLPLPAGHSAAGEQIRRRRRQVGAQRSCENFLFVKLLIKLLFFY